MRSMASCGDGNDRARVGSRLPYNHRMPTRKEAAVSFLRHAASGRVREAYDKHVSKGFRHHNPFFAGDAQALMTGMEENARQNPDKRLEVLHALEDGDLVAVHSRVQQKPGDRGAALVHLFRFEGDHIVELWDIGQPVPAESVNAHGMF
jgi:predicted SnoaL-like aldol condensation-catalyzing enzyme